jgi:cell division protein FtsB
MKKLIVIFTAVALAFGLSSMIVGCGPGKATDIKEEIKDNEPEDHEAQYEKLKKEQEEEAMKQGG